MLASRLDIIHFVILLILLFQVEFILLFINIDVPFKDGEFQLGDHVEYAIPPFYSLSKSGIRSDRSSFVIICLNVASIQLKRQIVNII